MKSSLRFLSALLTVLVAVSNGWAQSPSQEKPMTKLEKAEVLARISSTLERDAFVPGVDFKNWDKFISSEKDALDAAITPGQFVGAVNMAIQKFGFTHINLFPPIFAESRATQKRAGFGFRFYSPIINGLRISHIFTGSPAEKAGLLAGDLVLTCDGKKIQSIADVVGVKGQTSKLVVMRGTQHLEVTITRGDYSTLIPETVTWTGDIAVVTIPTFDIGYNPANVDKIMQSVSKAKGIVVDLRDNGGGRVMNLLHLSSYFLDHDTQPLGTFLGKAAVKNYEKDHPATNDLKAIAAATPLKVRASKAKIPVFKGPVSVLINGNSGSASEMFAAAIREQLKGKLYGSRSAGAVLASIMQPVEHGFLLQYPLLDYVTIKGVRLEGTALIPDTAVPTPRYGEVDTALNLAEAWINSSASSGQE